MFVTTLALRWLECTFHSVIVCIYALSRGLIINLRITIYDLRITIYDLFWGEKRVQRYCFFLIWQNFFAFFCEIVCTSEKKALILQSERGRL